ncbi:MAG: hypothetical protein IJV36_04125 [Prevotella sp.]|nr:hypothetical protein [Prevotella sp.]
MRVICAALFLAFTFAFLYFYQADVMTATQHLLSGGKTQYDRTIGAVLITATLYVLHLAVLALTRLTRRGHALTYFPSLLALAVLTGIRIHADGTYDFRPWHVAAPVLLLVFVGVTIAVMRWQQFDRRLRSAPITPASLWHNLLALALMFLFTGLASNHDDVLHFRLRAENCMLRRDYEGALRAGVKSLETDSSLTMLRIHALARSGQLGSRLFHYPLVGGSEAMMPDDQHLRTVFFPKYRLVRYPRQQFILCKHLLDRNLDAFATALSRDVAPGDSAALSSLPKHYREALVVYARQRENPVLRLHDDVLDADFADFQKLAHDAEDTAAGHSRLRDVYGTTFWYYFYIRQ